jgi:iron-sulfur cluster assembly accessory protein
MNKDIITVTDPARRFISNLCNENQLLKISINNKGCSGHSYEYELVQRDSVARFDETIIWENGGVCIDSRAVMHVLGSELLLHESHMERYLTWNNPQATNLCGCGTSFSLG